MEYEKQIEIKLEGNNCIINFPKEQNVSQQNNSLTNIDDISFSVSATSEEDLNSKNNIYNCCKDNNAYLCSSLLLVIINGSKQPHENQLFILSYLSRS